MLVESFLDDLVVIAIVVNIIKVLECKIEYDANCGERTSERFLRVVTEQLSCSSRPQICLRIRPVFAAETRHVPVSVFLGSRVV